MEVRVRVGEWVAVCVAVSVGVRLCVDDALGTGVWEGTGLPLGVRVEVCVGLAVSEYVAVCVAVTVGVGL